jgi:hypothetical protein
MPLSHHHHHAVLDCMSLLLCLRLRYVVKWRAERRTAAAKPEDSTLRNSMGGKRYG